MADMASKFKRSNSSSTQQAVWTKNRSGQRIVEEQLKQRKRARRQVADSESETFTIFRQKYFTSA